MNNKNFIITLVIIIVILALGALGFVISSNLIKGEVDDGENTVNKVVESQVKNDVIVTEKSDDKKEENNEEKYQNVVLTSKIGNEVLSKFCISNIYSSTLYKELDLNGLDETSKAIFTYVTITSNYKYHNMIKSSNEIGEYITKEDFETVYKELFGKEAEVIHKSVITDTLYNEEKGYYEYLTLGYGGIEFDFIIEIPYEIREYEDRVEALFYRVYARATSSVTEDGVAEQLVTLYDTSSRNNKIYSSSDDELQNNDSQQDYITKLIDDEEIKKDDLEKITYILKEEEKSYYISEVKR